MEHAYICGRCGGGGELHYAEVPDGEPAPATYEFHGDEAEHDPSCAEDDAARGAEGRP